MIADGILVLIRFVIPSVAVTSSLRRFLLFVGIVIPTMAASKRPRWLLVLVEIVLSSVSGALNRKPGWLLLCFHELAKDG